MVAGLRFWMAEALTWCMVTYPLPMVADPWFLFCSYYVAFSAHSMICVHNENKRSTHSHGLWWTHYGDMVTIAIPSTIHHVATHHRPSPSTIWYVIGP